MLHFTWSKVIMIALKYVELTSWVRSLTEFLIPICRSSSVEDGAKQE